MDSAVDKGKVIRSMHRAIIDGNLERVRRCLRFWPPSARVPYLSDGKTALHVAAMQEEVEIGRLLLEQKFVNIDERTSIDGYTPLHVAVLYGNARFVHFLLGEFADMNLQDKKGGTPLHIAAAFGDKALAKALLDGNTNVHKRTKAGLTARQMAEKCGYTEVAEMIRAFEVRSPLSESACVIGSLVYDLTPPGEAIDALLSSGVELEPNTAGLNQVRSSIEARAVCKQRDTLAPQTCCTLL